MSDNETGQEDSGTAPPEGAYVVQRLWLNSLDNCRRSLGRLIREFHKLPKADVTRFRALIYGFAVMLNYFKTSEELSIVDRIEALEVRVREIVNERDRAQIERAARSA